MRIRLLLLWVYQLARWLASGCLLLWVMQEWGRQFPARPDSLWLLGISLLWFPFVILAPLSSVLAQRLPGRWVLFVSSGYTLVMVGLFVGAAQPEIIYWAFAVMGLSLAEPALKVLLWSGTQAARVHFMRQNAWLTSASVAAFAAGLLLGQRWTGQDWSGLPLALIVPMGLYLLSMMVALPIAFPGAQLPAKDAPTKSFVQMARIIMTEKELRPLFLGQALLTGLFAATAYLLILLRSSYGPGAGQLFQETVLSLTGGFLGAGLVTGCQWHPRRALGWVSIGATGPCLVLLLLTLGVSPSNGMAITLGVCAAMAILPLRSVFQAYLNKEQQYDGLAFQGMANALALIAGPAAIFLHAVAAPSSSTGPVPLLLAVALIMVVWIWTVYYREFMEQMMEILVFPLHRLHRHGPGLWATPWRGPLIIVANHAAWFDPIFVARTVPCRIIPLMTSTFYDLPVLRILMRYVVRAVRVQFSQYRREVPEIREAIDALNNGECLVIFPEGRLRRKLERPLSKFGQGVWHILSEKPDIPVVTCWIEGNWGSFFSYDKGKPTKNKPMDFWRRIDVAVNEPLQIDPDLLTDHRQLRRFLMERCLETRKFIPGLQPLPVESIPEEEDPTEQEEQVEQLDSDR
jgi:1-acyl-sn-glycerol-3-phosphate acyltransferase